TDIENGNIIRTRELLSNLDNEDNGVLSLFAKFSSFTDQINNNNKIASEWKVSSISHEYYNDDINSDFLWNIQLAGNQTLQSMINEENQVKVGEETRTRHNLLIRSLFSKNDLKVDQTEGFHARPRIGALRFEYEFDKDLSEENGFWQTLNNTIFANGQTQLMFVGSIFGGTGASGIPTLLKRCQSFFADENPDTRSSLGMTLLLPYYTFPNLPEEDKSSNPAGTILRSTTQDLADPNLFILNSKLALSYYSETNFLKNIVNPSIYLIGIDPTVNMNNESNKGVSRAAGKSNQKNPPLPAELAATVAIQNYFANPIDGNSKKVVKLCKTEGYLDKDKEKWDYGKVLPETYNVINALNRLGMFCIFWKILSDRRPHKEINYDLIPFRDLHKLKNDRAFKWDQLFNRVKSFVESATTYLLELDANRINLEWFRESNEYIDALIEKKETLNNSALKISEKKLTEWLWELLNTINLAKSKNTENDDDIYFRILHGLMKICSDAYPYKL
ncbi:MAG: hypothetical protein LBE13_17560, partial [Bacteroidales bacterium]|nr:hypothetical protein [Bacteroidales bacterium]